MAQQSSKEALKEEALAALLRRLPVVLSLLQVLLAALLRRLPAVHGTVDRWQTAQRTSKQDLKEAEHRWQEAQKEARRWATALADAHGRRSARDDWQVRSTAQALCCQGALQPSIAALSRCAGPMCAHFSSHRLSVPTWRPVPLYDLQAPDDAPTVADE